MLDVCMHAMLESNQIRMLKENIPTLPWQGFLVCTPIPVEIAICLIPLAMVTPLSLSPWNFQLPSMGWVWVVFRTAHFMPENATSFEVQQCSEYCIRHSMGI